MKKSNTVLQILPHVVKEFIRQHKIDIEKLEEIRLRTEKPVFLRCSGMEYQMSHIVSREELQETLEYISKYSLYAYETEMRQGFLTMEGGHRIGLAGKVVIEEGRVKNYQYISSINIRICHEVKGCASQVLPHLIEHGKVVPSLILSPPGQGKTTMLRDLVRQVSDGNSYLSGQTVCVIDERSEIGGCYQGIPQNDVGKRTDILDNCPKAEGMMMMIRSMSPQVLAVDEIGTSQDVDAISYAMRCGVTVLATAHAASFEELQEKERFKKLYESRCFKRYLLLGKDGQTGVIDKIWDEWGQERCI